MSGFLNDTIAAAATPMARSAIGILRLSGPGAVEAVSAVFQPKNGRPLAGCGPHRLVYGTLFDAAGRPIDQALATFSRAPDSYTGEDTAELQCHGSPAVLALGLEHGRQATAAQSAVTEMTNELLKKNADLLKMGTIETAKEAERSVVDIETLQHTNQQLISTLDEVLNIQKEGAAKRKEAEVELGKIEGELKQKLMELRS